MRMMMILASLLLPLPATAFMAQNGMIAAQVGPTEIAVEYRARRHDTEYWCAAGDFAQRAMGVANTTRMWRASPKPRRAGVGIVFTLDPANKAEGAGLSSFGAGPHDGSLSVGASVGNYCHVYRPFWRD